MPWLGFFYKMAKCDLFVILDNVQYTKRGFTNRVKIKTHQGENWLTVPVKAKGRYYQIISTTEIQNGDRWQEKHLKTIQLNYKKAKYFDYLFPGLKKLLEKDWPYLSNLNTELIKFLKERLYIKTKIEITSNYNFPGSSTDLLINICKRFNGHTYLSGKGGAKYQDEKKYKADGIKLEYTDFIHPTYPQLWGNFIHGLSIIDLLFNCGPDSLKILLDGKTG